MNRARNDGDDACEALMDARALGSDAQQKVLMIAELSAELLAVLNQEAGKVKAAAGYTDSAAREMAAGART